MRVEWKQTEWCPVGQFIITAENCIEEKLLDDFTAFGMSGPRRGKDWKFVLHGRYSHTMNLDGITSFNFGYSNDKYAKKVMAKKKKLRAENNCATHNDGTLIKDEERLR